MNAHGQQQPTAELELLEDEDCELLELTDPALDDELLLDVDPLLDELLDDELADDDDIDNDDELDEPLDPLLELLGTLPLLLDDGSDELEPDD